MSKAIEVKYVGPSNTKGSRWSVNDHDGNRKSYPLSYRLNSNDDRAYAAMRFLTAMAWDGEWHSGELGNTTIFVCIRHRVPLRVDERRPDWFHGA